MRTFLHQFIKVSCLFLMISFCNEAHAQANRVPMQNHVSAEERTRLQNLSDKLDREFQVNRRLAYEQAKLQGWDTLSVDSNGTVRQLMGLGLNGIPIYYSTHNARAAITTRTNLVSGYLTGAGYTIGIWDAGAVRATHREFGGRVIYRDTVRTIESHPTHVAGTMVAAGKDPNAKGMAPEADLWAYSWDNDLAEMAKAASQGLLISNHSYGRISGWHYNDAEEEWYWYGDTAISDFASYYFGYYDEEAKSIDGITFNAKNYLPVTSAGNTRNIDPPLGIKHKVLRNGKWVYSIKLRASQTWYDGISGSALAKNVLTVGAVNPVNNYTGPSSVVMSGFSSWGPTDDGRIKPDIVGDGVGVYSSDYQTDSSYGYKNGTSMASPNVSGSLLLLQEQYNLNTGDFLSAAALKALAIHTADEAGPDPGPDYMFGWGLMNTRKAVDVINNEGGNHTIKNGFLVNNMKLDYALPSDGQSAYRVTIVWTDPAGTVSAPALNNRTPKLVNDLDIRVIDPSDGETHYPWRLNPDPGYTYDAATRGDNFRDNVEVIDIPYLPASDYIVRVSHKGTLANNQPFSLIISKMPYHIPELKVSAQSQTICPGKKVQYSQAAQDDFFTKYIWSFPGGVPSSYVGKTPPEITYNNPGTYSVVLIASNEYFTRNKRFDNIITVQEPKPGTATLKQVCAESSTRVSIDTTGKIRISSIDWYINGIRKFTGTSLSYSSINHGDIVKAVLKVSSDCIQGYNIETNSVTVNKPSVIQHPVSLAADTYEFCWGSSVTLTATVTDPVVGGEYFWIQKNYLWPASSTTNTLTLNSIYDGLDREYYCVYKSSTYCSGSGYDTSNVITLSYIQKTKATLSISTPKTKICNNNLVVLTAETTVPEQGRTIEWFLNGQFVAGDAMVLNIAAKDGDKVYCKVTSTDQCVDKNVIISNEINFIGTERVNPSVTINTARTEICSGDIVTFNATPTDGGLEPIYEWYHNEELVQSGYSSAYTTSNIKNNDKIYCMIYPNQCSYKNYEYSNAIFMTVRGEEFSKVTISAPSTSVCAGSEVTFTADLTHPGLMPRYTWKVNGNIVVNRGGPTFTTSSLNDGDVVDCTVQQTGTCVVQLGPFSNKIKMTVFQPGQPVLSVANVTPMCSNSEITFEANATNVDQYTTYQWNVNGEMKQNSTSKIFKATDLKQNDFVSCILFTRASCATSNTAASNYIQVDLKYKNVPTLNIATSAFGICENEPVEFNVYGGDNDPQSVYRWKVNGQTVLETSTRQNFVADDLENGDIVTCLFISGNGCLDQKEYLSNEIPVEIRTASPTISIASTAFCKGSPVTFYAITSDVPEGSLYYWKKNGSFEDTGEDSTYTPPYFEPGDVISCMLIPKACTAEDQYFSNEITIPEMPDVHPSVEIQAEGLLCPGGFFTFRAVTKDEGDDPTYIWYKNGKVIFADHYPVITSSTFQEGDILTCLLISNAPCALESPGGGLVMSEPFVVHPAIPVDVNLQLTARYGQVCQGQLQEFNTNVSVPENQLTYSWLVNNIQVENASGSSWSSSALGPDDKVTCLVQSEEICINPATASQTVSSNVAVITYPVFNIQARSDIHCQGEEAEFFAETFDAGMDPVFEWFVNDVSVQKGTSNTFISNQLNNGDRLICHLIPDNICIQDAFAVSNELVLNVVTTSPSVVTLKKISTVICDGGISEFQAEATNTGTHPVYEWLVNNIVVQSGDNYNYSTTALKNGDVVSCRLIREDACAGRQSFESDPITIIISPRSTPAVEIRPTQENYCTGNPVQLIATPVWGGKSPLYSWFINDSLVYFGSRDTLGISEPNSGDIIYCMMNTSEECVTENEVFSNEITLQINAVVTPSISVFASDTVICAGQPVTFIADVAYAGTDPLYEWKINGNTVQRNGSGIFLSTSLKNGDIVHCVLKSNEPCTDHPTVISNEITIRVINVPVPEISISAENNNSCQGEAIRFTATYVNAERPTFIWKVNGQEVKRSVENTFESNALANGDLVICEMTAVSVCSAEPVVTLSNVAEVKTIAGGSPSVEISADDTAICSGTTVHFTARITNGGDNPVIKWLVNDIVVQAGSSSTFSSGSLQNGDMVTAILQSDAPCTAPSEVASSPVEISVIQVLKPTVSIFASQTSICPGTEITFTATSENNGNAANFEWKVNGETIQLGASDVFRSNTLKDKDKISCTVHVSYACADLSAAVSDIIQIEVVEPIQPTIELKHLYDTICSDTEIRLELRMTNISSGSGFLWYKNGSVVGNNDHLVIGDLSAGDEIWCNISTKATNCDVMMQAVSDTFTAIVYPVTEFEVYRKGDTLFATAGYPAYGWYFDGRLITQGPDNFIVPETAGTYTVNATDPNGCADLSRTIDFVVTSVNNPGNIFRIYPNPTDGKIHIEFSNAQSGIISIYHVNGQLIMQPAEIRHLKNYSLDISDYPVGMYIISFEQPEHKWSEKIIKIK